MSKDAEGNVLRSKSHVTINKILGREGGDASPTTWWALKRVGPDDPQSAHTLQRACSRPSWGAAAFSGSAAALCYFQLPSWVGYAIVVVFCAALRWSAKDDHNSIGRYLGAVGALPIFLVDYAHHEGAHTFFLLWLILGLLQHSTGLSRKHKRPPPKRTEGLNMLRLAVALVQPFMQLAVFLWAAGHVSSATHLSLLDVVWRECERRDVHRGNLASPTPMNCAIANRDWIGFWASSALSSLDTHRLHRAQQGTPQACESR